MNEVLAQSADAVQIASQLGRLDFISALLAAVTIVLAFASIPLFVFLRSRAATVAKEEIRAQLEGLTSKLEAEAISKMQEMLSTLVKDYMDLVKSQAAVIQADEIAGAQEDAEHGDNL